MKTSSHSGSFTPWTIVIGVSVTFLNSHADAATRTWTGANSVKNWSLASNWSGNVAPVQNDSLTFPSGSGETINNNFGSGFNFTSLQFAGQYRVQGNMFTFSSSIYLQPSPNAQPSNVHFAQEVRPANNAIISTGTNVNNGLSFSNMYLSSSTSGTSLNIGGAGTVVLSSVTASSNTHLLVQEEATLQLTGAFPNFSGVIDCIYGVVDLNEGAALTNGTVLIYPGSILYRNGKAKDIMLQGDTSNLAYLYPTPINGANGPLTATNSLTFLSNSALVVDIDTGSAYARSNGAVQIDSQSAQITLQLNSTLRSYSINEEIILLQKIESSAISGRFSNLPEGSAIVIQGQFFLATYTGGSGNDLTLKRVATPLPKTLAPTQSVNGANRTLTVPLQGIQGLEYVAEASSDLTTWTPFQTVTIGAGGAATVTRTVSATAPRHYVRLRPLKP
jgi:hypothetical protein